jgi:phage-related tail protein
MRQYRARKKAEAFASEVLETAELGRSLVERADHLARTERQTAADAIARIAELETEVAHLKRQLAMRLTPIPSQTVNAIAADSGPIGRGVSGFNTRGFTPAPKK